jgi:hypothetical protein
MQKDLMILVQVLTLMNEDNKKIIENVTKLAESKTENVDDNDHESLQLRLNKAISDLSEALTSLMLVENKMYTIRTV